MSSDSLLCRILLDLKPKTKSIESITFDLPLPLGPTTDDMFLSNGPISCLPAYDLKFSRTMRWIIRRGCAVGAAATSEGGATSDAVSSTASIIVSSAGPGGWRQVLKGWEGASWGAVPADDTRSELGRIDR